MTSNTFYLPLSYEEARIEIGSESADLAQLFHFLPEFEEQILRVLSEIRNSGKVLFIYGNSGIGKTTFIHSLKYRAYLPIRKIEDITAHSFELAGSSAEKLHALFEQINGIALKAEEYTDRSQITCVAISALEHLEGEDEGAIRKFFMNLNGLLREKPLLILWQVNVKDDLDKMLSYARSIATTLTSRHLEYLEFTGPKQNDFPEVVRKNVSALYPGREIYDFQLHDGDLLDALKLLKQYPQRDQTIREYMELVLGIWEKRSEYIESIRETIPKDTELWIVLCHPEAEDLVERSTRRSRRPEDYYRADYNALDDYIKGSQKRTAQWPEGQLAWALEVIKTRILFIGTHAFVNAVAAFGPDVPGFPIDKEHMRAWGLPDEWYYPRRVGLFMARTPLVRQLAVKERRSGAWSQGNVRVEDAISEASKVFAEINEHISSKHDKWSDKPFNRALMLAIKESYENPLESTDLPTDRPNLLFQAEVEHPHLGVIPDILITDITNNKFICLELHYTSSTQQGRIIGYTLDKLKDYWDQIKTLFAQPRLF